MKKYLSIYFSLGVFALLLSCSNPYNYASDTSVSNSNGSRIDSLDISFIKDTIIFEGKQYTNEWDLFTKNELDSTLSVAGSPILYNYYLNRDIIRIVKLNTDTTTIIDINNDLKNSWLTYKSIINKIAKTTTDSIESEYTDINFFTINLENEQWKIIDSLVQNIVFYQMDKLDRSNKKSEQSYFVEYHSKERYFYIFTDEKNTILQELLKNINTIHNRIRI